jgi:hypothetical protein
VADVVHRELRLEPTRIARQQRGHDAGVVDEEVQRAIAEPGRERVDRGRHAEVELIDRDVRETRERGGRFRDVACGHDHVRTGGGKHARGLETDAGVATGYDRGGAVESALADHLAGLGLRAEARGKRMLRR